MSPRSHTKAILSLVALSLLTLTSASTINFNFGDATNDMTNDAGVIYSDSLVFQVQTYTRTLCRYSQERGTPFNLMTGSFEDNFETIHKKTLTSLSSGVHRYFIRCRDILDLNNASKGTAELEIIFKISNPIAAQIIMAGDTLNAGKYEISLITTKIPAATPKLSYSYNGISYDPIMLHGSGTNWEGYLIIPKTLGEQVGSFRFEATDLEGRGGNKIISGDVFVVDTKAPPSITTIEALGEYGQIKLEWYSMDEDIHFMNIYKSENPNVGPTDFYKSLESDNENYIDTDVSKGKTYYYKIAPEDLSGNVADLSREVSATTRIDNNVVASGLSGELISLVDALITEINLLEDDIGRAGSIVNEKGDSGKECMRVIGITGTIQSASSELSALEREVVNYKLQDLTLEALNSRIASSRVRLNMIKKKIPDSIATIDSSEESIKVSEDNLRTVLLEYAPELTPSQIDKSIKQSLNLIEENGLNLRSKISIFEIIYLDGSKSSYSVFEHFIDSTLVKTPTTSILLKIPSAIDSSRIDIENTDYTEEKLGLFRFETDTKVITYILDKELETGILNQIEVSPIQIMEDSTLITGYFLSDLSASGSVGMTLLMFIACSLVGYLVVMRKKQQQDFTISFIEKARTVKDLRKKGQVAEADSLYGSLKLDYAELSEDQKSKVFKKIKHLHKK